MRLDTFVDHARHAKRFATGAAIDERLGPGDDAIQKSVDLVAKAVLLFDFLGFGCDCSEALGHWIAAQAVAENFAFAEIAVEIVVARKDAHAPLGLVAHSARRDVGDAARLEIDTSIREVDAAAEHWRANRIHV